jgi:hypothetical protein
LALYFASKELKEDYEVVEEAFKQDSEAIKYALGNVYDKENIVLQSL